MPVAEYYKGRGESVMRAMKRRYGNKKGEQVFYATANQQKQAIKRRRKRNART